MGISKAPEKIVEVRTREEMAEAIRQHAGTSCRITWGSFSITFQELCEGEKLAEQVWCSKNPNFPKAWHWSGSAIAKAAPRSAKRRIAFADEVSTASSAWDMMPRKTWPKI